MSSQEVLWINIGIGVFIALIFLMRRSRQKEPSRLRLGMGAGAERGVTPSHRAARGRGGASESGLVSSEAVAEAQGQARVKNLNVIFNYNGHSWDAYEVLGLPAGAPMSMVNEAYQKALRSTQAESHQFLQVAFEAIRKSVR